MTTVLTRSQVARALDLSVSSVRRFEREGRLRPTVGEGGVHFFSPEEVDQLRLERGGDADVAEGVPLLAESRVRTSRLPVAEVDGDTAAKVFRWFEAGETPVTVVHLYRLQPAVVAVLYRQWVELSQLGRAARGG